MDTHKFTRDDAKKVLEANIRMFAISIRPKIGDRVVDAKDADDFAQEAVREAISKFDLFRGNSESQFLAWALAMLQSQLKMAVRRSAVRKRRWNAIQAARPARSTARASKPAMLEESKDNVWAAIDGLDNPQRTALLLREFEGMSYNDIAREMDKESGTVRKLVQRAKEKIRETLGASGLS